ncbi:hypothetical protein, partial [Novosphingobium sp. HII-3]|uniref:hypothetical protein n=1 Tax=Novosphingobium sp. HII-3 TaxID=2075565 RepID=UPI001E35CA2E
AGVRSEWLVAIAIIVPPPSPRWRRPVVNLRDLVRQFTAATAEVPAWYEAPAVARFIEALDVDELYLSRPIVAMGDDQLHFSGDGLEALGKMRRDYVDMLFGGTWQDAMADGRQYEYLDLEAEVPSVDAALAVHFGHPSDFGGDPDTATRRMRNAARWRAAQGREAA